MSATDQTSRRTRNLFVSYAREDRPVVEQLRAGLQRLHHEVWVDDQMGVGQAWWDEILGRIRQCDAVIVAVSPSLLESQASQVERAYAHQLGKAILPVYVHPVRSQLLPPDLAPLQIVDYCNQGSDAAFDLAAALAQLPSSGRMPDPMPVPPSIPVSYLSDLGARVHGSTLTLDEQLALVGRLRLALTKENESKAAYDLLLDLQHRHDLYHEPAEAIATALSQYTKTKSPVNGTATPSSATTESQGPLGIRVLGFLTGILFVLVIAWFLMEVVIPYLAGSM